MSRPLSFVFCVLGVLVVPAIACGPSNGASPAGVKSMPAADLAGRLEAGNTPLVLDVRTPGEFADGHIPSAVNIPHDELAARLDELPSDRGAEIVVHCKSGRRAGVAEAVLVEAGYTNLSDLEGHWLGWVEADRPRE